MSWIFPIDGRRFVRAAVWCVVPIGFFAAGCQTPNAALVPYTPTAAAPADASPAQVLDAGEAIDADDVVAGAEGASSEVNATRVSVETPASEIVQTAAVDDDVAAPTLALPNDSDTKADNDTDGTPKLADDLEKSLTDDSATAASDAADASLVPPPLNLDESAGGVDGLSLDEVISSVYMTFPLLHASITQRQQAAGAQLSTWGAFDRMVSASSENQFVSRFENYRHKLGLNQNIYNKGGNWFAQYQLGRGDFEPWYLEREKNEGGEFSLGLNKPLLQGRDIDARRAAIWRATYEMQRVEPAIRLDLIRFVLDGSVAYWNWVAAGRRYQLAEYLLELAVERNEQVRVRVEEGDLDPPDETENNRLVLNRRVILLDAQRQLNQAAAQLSLFYRDGVGTPLVTDVTQLPGVLPVDDGVPVPMADLQTAFASRPELNELDRRRAQIQVTAAEQSNNLLPSLDVYGTSRQDTGGRTSSKDEKQEFEFEAGIFFDVPIERRAARGRLVEAQAKIAQIAALSKMAQDNILVDLQTAAAAIEAAIGRVEAATESIDLARQLVVVEQAYFEEGESSLLEVTLREQQLAESIEGLIAARFELQVARAAYRAALGTDRLPDQAP